MASPENDWEYAKNMVPGMTYISKSFPEGDELDPALKKRFATKVIDSEGGVICELQANELIVRQTPANRQVIKALYFEHDRQLDKLIFQRFMVKSGKPQRDAISFTGEEIETVLWLMEIVRKASVGHAGKVRFSDEWLCEVFADDQEFFDFVMRNKERLQQFEDVKDLREYLEFKERREQLMVFENLLSDHEFFAQWKEGHGIRRDESVWQRFFEENHWIFGLGLNPIPMSALRGENLETTVQGFSVQNEGKRADALMKTNGRLSALCFVEIKKHTTNLIEAVEKPYRSGVWRLSTEVTGAISQCHLTVQTAMDRFRTKLQLRDNHGAPTGEEHFLYQPRTFLVVGSLDEFMTDHGPNETKYRSFELLRRNLTTPEIVTFDELLERARATVQLSAGTR